ncbi:hypothetical protein E2320_011599 [Naja naja]|nr:hypothetical protein E2320_011599 [Naja naja]
MASAALLGEGQEGAYLGRDGEWWPLPSVEELPVSICVDMARGQQKIQSQQKNAKKQAGQKKKQGHDQKAAAKAALIYTCTVCRTQMPDPKTFKQHFESKHPKTPLPPELADVQA